MKTYKERFLAGELTKEDINNEIEAWHEGSSAKSLSSFLGFTNREYDVFLSHPRVFWERLEEQKQKVRR